MYGRTAPRLVLKSLSQLCLRCENGCLSIQIWPCKSSCRFRQSIFEDGDHKDDRTSVFRACQAHYGSNSNGALLVKFVLDTNVLRLFVLLARDTTLPRRETRKAVFKYHKSHSLFAFAVARRSIQGPKIEYANSRCCSRVSSRVANRGRGYIMPDSRGLLKRLPHSTLIDSFALLDLKPWTISTSQPDSIYIQSRATVHHLSSLLKLCVPKAIYQRLVEYLPYSSKRLTKQEQLPLSIMISEFLQTILSRARPCQIRSAKLNGPRNSQRTEREYTSSSTGTRKQRPSAM